MAAGAAGPFRRFRRGRGRQGARVRGGGRVGQIGRRRDVRATVPTRAAHQAAPPGPHRQRHPPKGGRGGARARQELSGTIAAVPARPRLPPRV